MVCLLLGLTLTSLVSLWTLSLPPFPLFFHFCLLPESCRQHTWALQKHSLVCLIPETLICHEQKVHFGVEDLGLSLDSDI